MCRQATLANENILLSYGAHTPGALIGSVQDWRHLMIEDNQQTTTIKAELSIGLILLFNFIN